MTSDSMGHNVSHTVKNRTFSSVGVCVIFGCYLRYNFIETIIKVSLKCETDRELCGRALTRR